MSLLENVSGSVVRIYGRNGTVGTAVEELYSYDQPIDWVAIMSAVAKVDITSTSANDTSAGTGARTIRIVGCDDTGAIISEVLTLNGNTIVQSALSYKLIYGMEVLTTGTGKVNAGDIHCVKTGTGGTYTTGAPGTLTSALCKMLIGWNQSMTGIFCVPPGKTATVRRIEGMSRTQAAGLFLYKQTLAGGNLELLSVPLELGATSPLAKSSAFLGPTPTISAGNLLRLRVIGYAASAAVAGSMEILVR